MWIFLPVFGIFCAGLLTLWGNWLYKKRFGEILVESLKGYGIPILITALAGIAFWRYEYGIMKAIRLLIIVASLYSIAWIDYKKKIIPNEYILLLILIRIGILFAECMMYPEVAGGILFSSLLGAMYGTLIFLSAKLIMRGSIGLGDVKLFGTIGLYIGSSSIFSAMIISLLSAMGYGLAMVAGKRMTMKDTISFGPFIAIGTIITILVGA